MRRADEAAQEGNWMVVRVGRMHGDWLRAVSSHCSPRPPITPVHPPLHGAYRCDESCIFYLSLAQTV